MQRAIKKSLIAILCIIMFQSFISDKTTPNISPIQKKDGVRVNSGFGERIHPVTKTKKFHRGIDIKAVEGTPIKATADGIVNSIIIKGEKCGNRINIKHNCEFETSYYHLKDLKVKIGDKVIKGQVIGTVGSTGIVTGAHLHYEVIKNGERVDPQKYFIF